MPAREKSQYTREKADSRHGAARQNVSTVSCEHPLYQRGRTLEWKPKHLQECPTVDVQEFEQLMGI